MLRSDEFFWCRVERASQASILVCLEWQKTITIPKSLSPTPLVMRITKMVVSPLLFRPVWVRNSTPVFPQVLGEAMRAKNPSTINLNQTAQSMGVLLQMSTPPAKLAIVRSDPQLSLHNILLWYVMTFRRENEFNEVGCWLKEWYGNTRGSRPLTYISKLILSYWRVKIKIVGFWIDQMVCWTCSLNRNKG